MADVRQRVRAIARRARGLVCLYAISWFFATIVLAVLCLGLIDYLVRFQDLGIRLICCGLVWLVAVWSGFRFLGTAWRYRCSDLQAAQRIEGRFPGLGDLLSSAIAFGVQDAADARAGSLELRRAVIAQAEVAAQPLDFSACLDRRQSLRALCVAAALVAVVLAASLADGPSVALAAKRLLVPWGADAWPRRHMLEFVDPPTRLAAGQDFEVELVDANGQLPDQVQIHYWHEGDEPGAVETYRMQPLGRKLTHRLDGVMRSFRYRATGGDDLHMAWHELQVVEPARIVTQELLLVPPAYTGLAARPATDGFRTLRGTRVTLHIRVDKRLTSSTLETDTVAGERTIPLRLDADRMGCRLGDDGPAVWEISQSGSYGLRLVDVDGVDNGVPERWEVEAIADAPPTVSLKQPAADLFLTPRATVCVEAVVKDDLAIRSIALQYMRLGQPDASPQVVPLWDGPPQVAPESDQAARRDEEGMQRIVRYAWDLASLADLEPGATLDFRVVASDYRPQDGPSAARSITIISAEQHEERIVQRQAEILAQIAEVARQQQQTRGQTSQLAVPLREVGALSRDEIDQLQGAELNQRQVQQRLGHPSDGIQTQVAALIEDLRSNGLERSATMDRLVPLHAGIRALNENTLPGIEHRLIDALKLAREALRAQGEHPAAAATPLREPLEQLVRDVTAGQEQVVRALEQMLGQLAQWDSYRRLATEVGRFRREQVEVRQRTEALRQETFSRDVRDLTDSQRVALYRMAEQQNDIALRFDGFEVRMDTTRRQLAADDAQVAAALDAAITMARRAGVSADMRDAAHEMEANRLSQATQQQDEAIQWLGELQDILAHRQQDTQAYRHHERLAALFQAATALRGRQQRLAAETRQLEPDAGPDENHASQDRTDRVQRLAARQAALGQDAHTLQQTIMDLRSLAMSLRDAGNAAAQAAERLQRQDTGPVTQRHQQNVIDALTRMLDVLRDEQPPPREPDEARPDAPDTPESPERDQAEDHQYMLVQLRMIRALQQELNSHTTTLDQVSRDAEGWSAPRVEQQQELTSRQSALADLVQQLQASDSQPGAAAQTPPANDPPDRREPVPNGPAESIDQRLLEGLPRGTAPRRSPDAQRAADDNGTGISVAPESSGASGDPLQRVNLRMRDVAQRLAQRDTSETTQSEQRQIVAELSNLIDQLASQGRSQARQQASSQAQPEQDDQRTGGQEAAKDSASGAQQASPADDSAGTVQRAMGEVWGHLPERFRRQIQNAGAIEFLPQYRNLIEDYYRRMAEERETRR